MGKYNFAAETLIEKNKDYIDAIAKTEACLNDGYSIELFKNPGPQESLKVPPFAERIRSFKKVNDLDISESMIVQRGRKSDFYRCSVEPRMEEMFKRLGKSENNDDKAIVKMYFEKKNAEEFMIYADIEASETYINDGYYKDRSKNNDKKKYQYMTITRKDENNENYNVEEPALWYRPSREVLIKLAVAFHMSPAQALEFLGEAFITTADYQEQIILALLVYYNKSDKELIRDDVRKILRIYNNGEDKDRFRNIYDD